MSKEAEKLIKEDSKSKLISFKGNELVELNLNLLYNVGKASKSPPMMVNLTYQGNPEKPKDIYSLVGKVNDFLIFVYIKMCPRELFSMLVV